MGILNVLSKVDPNFRKMTDLLFFSDREDIDIVLYKKLLKENYQINIEYFFDRFCKSCEISWEPTFWHNRFLFIRSLKDKLLIKRVDSTLYKKIKTYLKNENIDLNSPDYLQFVQLCKVKSLHKNDLKSIKTFLMDLFSYVNAYKLYQILNSIIPLIFNSFTDYFYFVAKNSKDHYLTFKVFRSLKKRGVIIEPECLNDMIRSLLFNKNPLGKVRRAHSFFFILSDVDCRESFKKTFTSDYSKQIPNFIKYLDLRDMEGEHFSNIKNLIYLDSSLADDIATTYLEKIYARSVVHKKANADKIIKLLKLIPEISPKKVIFWLSSMKRVNDVNYVLKEFPSLKSLVAFL